MERRFKCARVTQELIIDNPTRVLNAFKGSIPVEVIFEHGRGIYTYILYSPDFPVIEEGTFPPDLNI